MSRLGRRGTVGGCRCGSGQLWASRSRVGRGVSYELSSGGRTEAVTRWLVGIEKEREVPWGAGRGCQCEG